MRKYKVGQKVKMIKETDKEYRFSYSSKTIENLRKHNYIFTIKGLFSDKYYDMAEDNGAWQDIHIKGLFHENIDSRFEILDL